MPISIDTEGARLRTGRMSDRVTVFEGGHVRLVPEAFWGDSYTIPITPGESLGRFEPGALVSIDFDTVILRVDRVIDGAVEATVVSGGDVGSRKAVTALPSPSLPSFSEKDRVAARIALENGVREFALSFCEDPATVDQLRKMVGPGCTIVAKIESRGGVSNLDRILARTDKILIDRGDLSREVRIEAIPMLQKAIVRRANQVGVPVYVATNLLESMITRRVPTRAEVNDVINTLLDGADGLVLSGETAVGIYPVESARMIASLIKEYDRALEHHEAAELLGAHPLANGGTSLEPGTRLSAPTGHGGHGTA